MLIETWIAAVIMCGISIMGIASILYALAESQRREDAYTELTKVREENAELRHYIAVQKTKSILGVANDFYNEGEKK